MYTYLHLCMCLCAHLRNVCICTSVYELGVCNLLCYTKLSFVSTLLSGRSIFFSFVPYYGKKKETVSGQE